MSAEHAIPEWLRFVAYFEGHDTSEERAEMERWIEERPGHAAVVRKYRIMWQARRQPTSVTTDRSAAIEQVMASIRVSGQPVRWSVSAPRGILHAGMRDRWGAGRRVRIAASVLVGVGISWFAVWEYASRRHVVAIAAVPTREVITKRGERATLDLTDGTRVVLAPESRLRIPGTYRVGTGLGARDLELDGEAYFEVTHDTARPFRVRTAAGIAEDLGTQFVVTSYPETRGMRVVVASGEVAIRQPETRTPYEARPLALLRYGDFAQLDAVGTVHTRHGVDTRRYLAWTSGRLLFDNTPLRDALGILTRWYDVEFRLGDPAMAARFLTVTFDGESVQHIVRFLEILLGADAEWQGRVVTFIAHPANT